MPTQVGPSWSVPENRFVGEIARTYDQPGTGMFTEGVVEATVDCLVELTDGGAAMEFAIGTGRVAVPLAARGVPVAGIELSADMLDVLRSKPEASDITAVEGDMAVTFVEGGFSLRTGLQHDPEPDDSGRTSCVFRKRCPAPSPWWPLCNRDQRARSSPVTTGQLRCHVCIDRGLHRPRRFH